MNRDDLFGIPLLIVGNKVDLIKSLEKSRENQLEKLKEELFDFFNFKNINNRDWALLFTSVKTKYNIDAVIHQVFNLVAS